MTIPITVPTHWLTQMIVFAFALIYGIEVHSGYDFGLHRTFWGIWGFAPFHDLHHSAVTCSYGGDRLLGTYNQMWSNRVELLPIHSRKDT